MVGIGIFLSEGARIFASGLKSRFFPKEYIGDADIICREIVKECWNGKFFQTSTTNFKQFWTRDFGWCVSSLLKLNYTSQVHQTLKYALIRFQQYNKVTTTITPDGEPYNYPLFAVDSLPWLIHSIKISNFPYYDYKHFLDQEIIKYFHKVVDPNTGLVRKDTHFSSIKDFAIRNSSCYDNCMLAMLARDLKGMKLINPFGKYDYTYLIIRYFWNGSYFYDDLDHKNYVAGDANIFPFLVGITSDKEKLSSILEEIKRSELDYPFPLKYTNSRKGIKFISNEIFLRDYESNALWTHMGPLFIKLVQQIDPEKAADYKYAYKDMIEKNKNYLEVFFSDGKPFKSPFYNCDQGMLWAANYLTL